MLRDSFQLLTCVTAVRFLTCTLVAYKSCVLHITAALAWGVLHGMQEVIAVHTHTHTTRTRTHTKNRLVMLGRLHCELNVALLLLQQVSWDRASA